MKWDLERDYVYSFGEFMSSSNEISEIGIQEGVNIQNDGLPFLWTSKL